MFKIKYLNNLDFNTVFEGFINSLELWGLLGSHYHKKILLFSKSKKGDLQSKTRNQGTKCKIKGSEEKRLRN